MDRRELLTSVGAAIGTASLAGCLSEYQDVAEDVGETTTGESTETTTGADAPGTTDGTATGESTVAATETATLADTSLEVVDSGCGQLANEASVSFREADLAVDVTGTIPGSNACYIAELADASYDADADALVLTVASTQEEGSEVCSQCITEVDYEATATFEGGLPGTVEVVHDAQNETTTVATAESG